MDHTPTEDEGRIALRDHAVSRALFARSKHGPAIDAAAILRILDDREIVRYPAGIRYDAADLHPGEFAHAMQLSDHPRQGFCLFIHPAFETRRDLLPLIIAYHIPAMNYGDIAEPEDCEAFGAALLGLDVEDYYQRLCSLADSIGPSQS
jgi:hypothetical protein